jgi:hypothetical protein
MIVPMIIGATRSGPVTDHEMELLDEGLYLFEIFAPSFVWLEVEGSTKCDHVAEIPDLGGRKIRILDLFEHSVPDLS